MMEQINTLLEEIKNATEGFMVDATSNLNGNKAAGRRARKASLTLTKLFKDYRILTLKSEKTKE
jgi:hypothetical protein